MVNLIDHQLEVFTDPSAVGYGSHRVYGRDDEVTLCEFADVALRGSVFLPA